MKFNSEKLTLPNEAKQVVNIDAINSLTKLLATEDVNIVHSGSATTAMFNVETRTLILPAWKGLSKLIYVLFSGHEVGHALFTPANGFNHPLIPKKFNTQGFRSILNVTEDVRIEKRVKRKYPGLRADFTEGYKRLLNAGFFGRTLEEIAAEGNIADRLNVRFKGGTDVAGTITFADDEKDFVERGFALETFEDAVLLAIDIYEKMVEDGPGEGEGEDGTDTNPGQGESGEGESEGENPGGDTPPEGADVNPEDSSGSGESDEDGEDGEDGDSEGEESSDDDTSNEAGNSGSIDSPKNDDASGDDEDDDSEFDPKALTDEATRSNSAGLVDVEQGETVRATLPHGRIDAGNYVHDTKRILEEFDVVAAEANDESFTENLRIESLKYFNSCKPVVAYLAKEFEMRKAADQHRRATTGRTGVINVNALHSYKYNEDLFLKKTITPDAKNHGMVMFIDLSGSMNSSIAGAFEQVINLVLFCKKVSIPFEVYGFGDARKGESTDKVTSNRYKDGDVVLNDSFYLRKFISSELRASDYRKALEYLFFMKHFWSGDSGYYGSSQMMLNEKHYYISLPRADNLGSTPLNDAIIVGMELLDAFRKKTGVAICNAVFLTDGESNGLSGVYNAAHGQSEHITRKACRNGAEVILHDDKSRKVMKVDRYGSAGTTTAFLLDAMRNRCGVRASGFFILPSSPTQAKRQLAELLGFDQYDDEKVQPFLPKLRKDGVVVTGCAGYDIHFAIRGGKKLKTSEDGILDSVEDGAKVSTIRSAFKKGSKTKVKSRVLLNKFIEVIA